MGSAGIINQCLSKIMLCGDNTQFQEIVTSYVAVGLGRGVVDHHCEIKVYELNMVAIQNENMYKAY